MLYADGLPSAGPPAVPNMTKSAKAEIGVSKFLPPAWGPWLENNGEPGVDTGLTDMQKAEIATARVLDECVVLSGVLKDELAKTAVKLT